MNDRLDKIKKHVSDNKITYAVGGACFVVGAATAVVFLKKADVEIAPKIQQILSYKPHATLEVHIEALGDPGNIIQDTTTGIIYASQRQAARELGLDPSSIRRNMQGISEHVKGHKFQFLAKAMVPETA